MKEKMPETGVVFALIHNGKILMQQRDGNCKRFPFMWCLPGGGSDDGENYEQTLLREVKEEYNIDLDTSQCNYLMDYKDGNDPMGVYVCKINKDQRPELREGLAMKWMTIEEIEELELGFNHKGIISTLKKVL